MRETSLHETRAFRRVSSTAVCLLIVSIMLIGYLAIQLRNKADLKTSENEYNLLSPDVARSNINHFLAHKDTAVSYAELKPLVVETLTNNVKGHFSFYLEDLTSGTRLGINENDLYRAWSLLKVSVMVTILKKVEQQKLSLDRKVPLKPEANESESVFPSADRAAVSLSVRELIDRLIKLSDNKASFALAKLFTAEEFQEGLLAMGLPQTPPDQPKTNLPLVSAKHYANLLRSLYYSGYLKKPFCQLALAILSDTVYDSQIRKDVPYSINLAHMVGFNAGCGDFHDCGIIYLPGKPYLLCVMSTGSTREESDRVISMVSRQVYEFMIQH